MAHSNINYDGYREIAVSPSPVPERIDLWWRRRWHFTLSEELGPDLALPPPIGSEIDTTIIVVSWWPSSADLMIDIFTDGEAVNGSEITYISLIGAWLRSRFPSLQVSLEGSPNHALLSASRIDQNADRILRDHGY